MSIIGKIGILGAFAAVVGAPYEVGYAQAKLAPEATEQHRPLLENDCRRGITLHDKATCLTLKGIEFARN